MVGRWSDDALEWGREVTKGDFLIFKILDWHAAGGGRALLGAPMPPTPPADQPEIGSRSVYQFNATLLSVHPCALPFSPLPMRPLTACNHSHRPWAAFTRLPQAFSLRATAMCSMHMLEVRPIALLSHLLSGLPHPSRMRLRTAFSMYVSTLLTPCMQSLALELLRLIQTDSPGGRSDSLLLRHVVSGVVPLHELLRMSARSLASSYRLK